MQQQQHPHPPQHKQQLKPLQHKSAVSAAVTFISRPPLIPSHSSLSRGPKISFAKPATCSMGDKALSRTSASTATPPWTKLSTYTIPLDLVNGPVIASPAKEWEYLRLFGQKEADLRIIFYRDHALWCPYCHKVQLLLELKRIPYMVKKINMSCYGKKPPEFLKKVPSGLLPVIELDGKIITESMDIMFLIEETFQSPYKKTIPVDDNEMMQAFHQFMRLERVFIGAWLNCLRGPLSTLDRGLEPVHHALDVIEKRLAEFDGPYFYPGDEPTFVDINFSSIFERSKASLMYWRNLDITEGRPNLQKWFRHWDGWTPAIYLRSDEWTHIGALPPQIGPVRFSRTRTPVSLNVDLIRSRHVLNDGPERALERNIAAATLCRKSALVTADAIRGAQAEEPDHNHIENALRVITQVLFDPDLLEVLEERVRAEIPHKSWSVVGNAIRFERIRLCAPRDMPIHSMEQFSGAINWLLRTLEQEL